MDWKGAYLSHSAARCRPAGFPYRDGFRAGYLDVGLGYSSDYASRCSDTDPAYVREYADGYRDGKRSYRA